MAPECASSANQATEIQAKNPDQQSLVIHLPSFSSFCHSAILDRFFDIHPELIGRGMPSDHFVCDHVIMTLTIQHHHRSGLHQAVGRAARVGSCVSHARVFHPERALYCFGFHGD